ncbi:MAG: GGDEF domain-containing protein [Anaerolineales bacterium]|nr:MAG: GGDEF domain-containing protein [Anaerolineales bacterium]
MLARLIAVLESAGRIFWTTTGVILLFIVSALDYVTGAELSFSLFYLIPITIFSWAIKGNSGILVACISAGIWLAVDILSGARYSNIFTYFWNTIIRLGFFLFPVLLLRTLEQERSQARTDFLTGTVNNRLFNELMQRELDRSIRYKHPFTIAFIDIDNFKTINDTYGHSFGNTVLRAIAEHIKKNLRKTDIIARMGGDEFAILLPETDATSARTAISNMVEKLSGKMLDRKWSVTFSIGVLTLTSPNISVDQILGIADTLMYSVKNNGKNGVEYLIYMDE